MNKIIIAIFTRAGVIHRLQVNRLPSWIPQVGYYEPDCSFAQLNLTRELDLSTCFAYESKVIFFTTGFSLDPVLISLLDYFDDLAFLA